MKLTPHIGQSGSQTREMTDIKAAYPVVKAVSAPTERQLSVITSDAHWPKVDVETKPEESELKEMTELNLSVAFLRDRSIKKRHFRHYFSLPKELYIGALSELLNGISVRKMLPGTWIVADGNGSTAEIFGYHETVEDAPLKFDRVTPTTTKAGFMSQKQRDILLMSFYDNLKSGDDREDFPDGPVRTDDSLIVEGAGESVYYLYTAQNADGQIIAFALVGYLIVLLNEDDYEPPKTVASTVMKRVPAAPVAAAAAVVDLKQYPQLQKVYTESITWLTGVTSAMSADLKARETGTKPQHTADELKAITKGFDMVANNMSGVYTYLGATTPSDATLRVVMLPRESSDPKWEYDIYLAVPPNVATKVGWTVDRLQRLHNAARYPFGYTDEQMQKARADFQLFRTDLQKEAMGTLDEGVMVRFELYPMKCPFESRTKYDFVKACINAYDRLN